MKGSVEEEKREKKGKRKGTRKKYSSAHTATPKAAVEIPFVGNTNLQAELPLSEASRICESVPTLGHNPSAELDSGGYMLPMSAA